MENIEALSSSSTPSDDEEEWVSKTEEQREEEEEEEEEEMVYETDEEQQREARTKYKEDPLLLLQQQHHQQHSHSKKPNSPHKPINTTPTPQSNSASNYSADKPKPPHSYQSESGFINSLTYHADSVEKSPHSDQVESDFFKNGALNNEPKKKKRPLFQRLWYDHDVISLLKGILEYKATKGLDPMYDMDDFLPFMSKGKLSIKVNRSQLYEKMWHLRKSYVNKAKKLKFNGVYSKIHKQHSYKLSEKIWRDHVNVDTSTTIRLGGRGKNSVVGVGVGVGVDPTTCENEVIREGLSLLKRDKRLEVEQMWKLFKIEQAELHLKRNKLYCHQAKLALEALRVDLC